MTEREQILQRLACGEIDASAPEVKAMLAADPKFEEEIRAMERIHEAMEELGEDERAALAEPADPADPALVSAEDRVEAAILGRLGDASDTGAGSSRPWLWAAALVVAAVGAIWWGLDGLGGGTTPDGGGRTPLGAGDSIEIVSPAAGSVIRASELRAFSWSGGEGQFVVSVYRGDDEFGDEPIVTSPRLDGSPWQIPEPDRQRLLEVAMDRPELRCEVWVFDASGIELDRAQVEFSLRR